MQIVKIIKSPVKNKRLRAYMDDGKHYDFGLLGASTYIEHHDNKIRDNYRKRHLGNDREYELISTLTPSPSLFAYYILWGDYTNINNNKNMLNKIFNYKEKYNL
jgi:hypothetical protein